MAQAERPEIVAADGCMPHRSLSIESNAISGV
jgi:hypothetical protein